MNGDKFVCYDVTNEWVNILPQLFPEITNRVGAQNV